MSLKQEYRNYKALIWHFDGTFYFGDWKEILDTNHHSNSIVNAYKEGFGLRVESNNWVSDNFSESQTTSNLTLYYGQFKNNMKDGYGIQIKVEINQEDRKNYYLI